MTFAFAITGHFYSVYYLEWLFVYNQNKSGYLQMTTDITVTKI